MLPNRPVVIGISGISGAGKTYFLNALKAHYKQDIATLSFDDYYRHWDVQQLDENGQRNFDLPSALDHDLFFTHLIKLMERHPVMHRRYRFENFESPEETFIISPAEIILAEGLFVFEFAEIDALLDYRIFIDTDLVESLNRRLLRDETERGIQPDKSLYQWQNHVIPAYEKFILPHKKRCDLLLDGKDLPDNNLAKFREMIQAKS